VNGMIINIPDTSTFKDFKVFVSLLDLVLCIHIDFSMWTKDVGLILLLDYVASLA
jgi:hypothetical protein